ncbi:hypothetical protein GGE07_006541 [Sinorhizobium terangae]|nr:hypothetical protein [Sinorhizobium terangae]MBB4189835.1 hypothetical protein [Sinorhizobium terangae]
MIAVDRLLAGDNRVLKVPGLLLGHEKLDVFVQRSLMPLSAMM